jgi:phosphohistidine phosphatase
MAPLVRAAASRLGEHDMRTLILLRHLKSSWDDPGLPDHDRPLAPRGRRAGKRIRREIQDEGIAPQLVLCSSAVRAVGTWNAIRTGIPKTGRVRIEDGLYAASAESLLERLTRVPDEVGTVLLIAHNPGIAALAVGLTGTGDAHALERMQAKYPTGGLATLRFDGSWADLGWARAQLLEFVVPRELSG